MLLLSTRDPGLPRLAWQARAYLDGIEVCCGEAAEIGAGFIVEGVRPFASPEGEFDRDSAYFLGSGIRILEQSAVFVPSIATTDPLCHAHRANALHVSNSLPLPLRRPTKIAQSPASPYDAIKGGVRWD